MATEPGGKTDQAKTEVLTEPPPKWLIELTKRTFDEIDEANRLIDELDRKYGR